MASDKRMFVTLALVSAVLAALVPGVIDTPALATVSPVTVAVAETLSEARPVRQVAAVPVLERQNEAGQAGAGKVVAPASQAKPARVRVPVGCERLVSPLVRSAAASQLSRCVT